VTVAPSASRRALPMCSTLPASAVAPSTARRQHHRRDETAMTSG
jgi:hypothetical protein